VARRKESVAQLQHLRQRVEARLALSRLCLRAREEEPQRRIIGALPKDLLDGADGGAGILRILLRSRPQRNGEQRRDEKCSHRATLPAHMDGRCASRKSLPPMSCGGRTGSKSFHSP